MKKYIILEFCYSFFFQITSKVQRFWKFWWLHRKDLINIYQKQSELFYKHLYLDLWRWFLMWKDWIYVSIIQQFFSFLARFSDLVNWNICITKIYWTKSNFPSNAILCQMKKKTNIRSFLVKELSNSATLYLFTLKDTPTPTPTPYTNTPAHICIYMYICNGVYLNP